MGNLRANNNKFGKSSQLVPVRWGWQSDFIPVRKHLQVVCKTIRIGDPPRKLSREHFGRNSQIRFAKTDGWGDLVRILQHEGVPSNTK
jgi:hypothetical protein